MQCALRQSPPTVQRASEAIGKGGYRTVGSVLSYLDEAMLLRGPGTRVRSWGEEGEGGERER